jgi:flagellar biosynthesis protein FlhA
MVTIGDGLVSQIPALLISTSMGVVVTRSASEGSMGREMVRQLTAQPYTLIMAAVILVIMCLIPGFPWPAMLVMAAVLATTGIIQLRSAKQAQAALEPDVDETEEAAAEKRKPENVTSLLEVHPIELELGYGIIPLVDVSQGGDLVDRVVMIRRQCALDLGIIVPSIRLRDNIQIGNNEYVIKLKGVEISRGEVLLDHFMALNPGGATGTLSGIPTIEPAFGLPAQWITEQEREKADLYGYTTIDPPSVIATHLTEVIKHYGYELLSRQQVQTLLDNVKKQQPALVDEIVPKMFGLGEIQKILANLLRESVPVRDMITILETISEYGGITRDTDLLTEYCRQNLKRAISRRFVPDGKARVITLGPRLEQEIADHVRQTEHGSYVAMEPDRVQAIFANLKSAIERMTGVGVTPIVLTSPAVRRHFKRLTEQLVPDLVVLSYGELDQNIEIYSDWVVNIQG